MVSPIKSLSYFSEVSFVISKNSEINLTKLMMIFPGTKLPETKFPETRFPGDEISWTKFPETRFPGDEISGTKLPGTKFPGTKLPNTLSLFVLTRVYSITLIWTVEHHDSGGHITESFLISINNNPSEENGASHSQLAPGPQPSLIRPCL